MHVHACRHEGGREGVGLLFNCFKRSLSINQPTTNQRSKTGAGEMVHQKLLKLSDLAVHVCFATGCTSEWSGHLHKCLNACSGFSTGHMDGSWWELSEPSWRVGYMLKLGAVVQKYLSP